MATAKRNAMSVDIFGTTVTVTFSNGKDLAIDCATLTPEIQRMAMLHGIKQKLVDAGAIARNTDTGLSASIDDKHAAVAEVHARLTGENPTWNKERGNGGEKPAKQKDLLVLALMRMKGASRDIIEQFLATKTKADIAALKKNPRVLAAMAELQAENGTNGVDTDALLGELGDDVEPTISNVDTGEPLITPQLAMPTPKRTRKAVAA